MASFAIRIREHPAINTINRFLASPPYIIIVMLLTVLANFFSLELPVYTIFAAAAAFTCLFGNDVLPLMPLFICCYLVPSAANNPGRNTASVFYGASGIYIGCIVAIVVASIIFRAVTNRDRFFSAKPMLHRGMLVLLGGYLLSGIGSAAYPAAIGSNLLFALIQGGAILIPYWLFSCGVDWKNVRRNYFAWIGFCTGGVLALQILWIYLTSNVVIDGIIQRMYIYTGWGMYNNMGLMLAMMIPYAFCLATKYRRGWLGTVAGSVYLVCVLLTCSRSSILGATAIYITCIFLMLYHARNRKHNTIALITVSAVIVLSLLLFHNQILRLFSDLLGIGLDPSHRDEIFYEGWKLFLERPVFGNSFFSPGYKPWAWSTVDNFNTFFPPRWHNTIVQLVASCGLVGLGAYLLHRVQTVRMFLRHKTKENAFIACSILVLIGCGMFDCHFFNVGPVLFYSMALAFAENRPDGEDPNYKKGPSR